MTRRFIALLPLAISLALGCTGGPPEPQGSPREPLDATAPPPKDPDIKPPVSKEPAVAEDPEPVAPPSEEPPEGGDDSPAEGDTPVLTFADEATKARAAELAKQIDGARFPHKLRKLEDALAFLHLAHTSEDAIVAAAALEAIATIYWGRSSEKYRQVDSDYNAVVAYRLVSDNPAVKTSALVAADKAMDAEPPDPKVTERLLELMAEDEHPATRIPAITALAGAKPLTGTIQSALTKALDDKSDAVVALALQAITHYTSRFSERDKLVTKLTALIKSENPGVRGKALASLCNVSHEEAHRERTAKIALELLEDDTAYVRGEAVYAIGMLRRVGHAGEIVKKLGDDAKAAYAIDGWTKLDGSADRKRLLAPGGSSVTGTALLSLSLLSTETDDKFEYVKDIVRTGVGKEDYGPAIKKAKAWYAKNKSKLEKKK